MAKKIKWNKGAPPHCGWWLCKDDKPNPEGWSEWRWWNGLFWGWLCYEQDNIHSVAYAAKHPYSGSFGEIQWSDYYPANARVPRVDPRKVAA